MEVENIKTKIFNKENSFSRKVRFYPSKFLGDYLKDCCNASRFFYNKSLEYIKKNNNKISSFVTIRKNILKSNKDLKEEDGNLWQKNIPYDTRQLVIKDAITSFKSCLTNLKRKNIKNFDIKFKKKVEQKQYCHIEKRTLNTENQKLFPSMKNEDTSFFLRKRYKKWWNENKDKITEHNFKVIIENSNKYYFCFTLDKESGISNKDKEKIINNNLNNKVLDNVALDPGIRTFQTFYSSEGVCGKLGDKVVNDIYKRCEKIDNLKSTLSKTNKDNETKRKKLMTKIFSLITKVKNIVKDLHWRTISFLTKNFKNIIIPKFDIERMTKKEPNKIRNINNKSVRNLLNLSHGSFIEKLKWKCQTFYVNRKVLDCNESYTSKTCGKCGNIDKILGSKKIYECQKCNFIQDRDINGARNIMIKYFKGLVQS